MADRSFILEVILQARDDMASAFARATGELEAFNKELDKQKVKAAESSAAMDKAQRSQAQAARQQTGTSRELKAALADLNIKQKESLDNITRLERATDSYTRAQRDGNKTSAQRASLLNEMNVAEKALSRQLREKEGMETSAARRMSQSIRDQSALNARLQEQKKILGDITREAKTLPKLTDAREIEQSHAAIARLREQYGAMRGDLKSLDSDLERTFGEARQMQYARAAENAAKQSARAIDEQTKAMERYKQAVQSAAQIGSKRTRLEGMELPTEQKELVKAKLDLDYTDALGKAEIFKKIIEREGKVKLDVDLDIAKATAEAEAFKKTVSSSGGESGGIFGGLKGILSDETGSIARFDNVIRGAVVFLVTGFLQPLITVAGAAGGALVALASSAIYAGGALGGALTAGIAQALPGLGILAIAAVRLQSVFKAVQQTTAVQQAQFQRAADARQNYARTSAEVVNAEFAVQNALNGVTQAQERLRQAQIELTTARRDAARNLVDLINKEREAQLAAEGAALSQRDAQKALQAAVATGGDVAQAQLQAQQARLNVARTTFEARTQAEDTARGLRQGVEGAPPVRQARIGLRQAQLAVPQAQQQVRQAQLGLQQARIAVQTGGSGSLALPAQIQSQYLQSQLTGTEKILSQSIGRIYAMFTQPSGPLVKLSDAVLRPFIGITDRIVALTRDPKLMGALQGLAGGIGKMFAALGQTFLSPQMIRIWEGIIKSATQNLGPLTSIIGSIGKSFLAIAVEAGPALREFFGFLATAFANFARWATSKPGRNSIAEFFKEGMVQAEAWLRLGAAIIRLFLAIAGPGGGAKTGLDFVKGATDGINRLTTNINKGGEAAKVLHRIFQVTKDVIAVLGPVIASIGGALYHAFSTGTGSVKAFATFMTGIVVPVATTFIIAIGKIVTALGKFAQAHPGLTKFAGELLGVAAAFAFVSKVAGLFSPIFTVVTRLWQNAPKILAMLGIEVESTAGAFEALWGVLLANPWIAVVAGIVLLLAKLGLLPKLLKVIEAPFIGIWNQIKKPIGDLIKQVKLFGDNLAHALGFSKGFGSMLKGILGPALDLTAKIFKDIGSTIGSLLVPPLKIVTGIFKILNDILTGNFKKIPGDFLAIGKAITFGLLNALTAIPRLVLKIIVDMVSAILHFLGISSPSRKFHSIGTEILRGLENGVMGIVHLGEKIVSWIGQGISKLWSFITHIGRTLISLWWKGVTAEVGLITGIGKWLLDQIGSAISSMWHFFESIGSTIINAIVSGIKKAPGKLLDAVKSLGSKVLHAGGDLNPVNWFSSVGGAVGLGYGGGDRISARLEEGEHVLSKEEVRNAGGHGAIFAMRRALGGGGQGGPAYAVGGAIGAGAAGATDTRSGLVKASMQVDFQGALKDIFFFGTAFVKEWEGMWQKLNTLTQNALHYQIGAFAALVKNVENDWNSITENSKTQLDTLYNNFKNVLTTLDTAVFNAFWYVGDAANKALKSFGAQPVNFGLGPIPKFAGGGFLGNSGERGEDKIMALLGRGEAVLNWTHQKFVDPALRAMYGFGLGEMFDRTKGEHAGGGIGYASGGPVGGSTGGSGNTHWDRLMQAANKVSAKNFPYVWGGGHEQPSRFEPFDCSGAVSYVTQQAGYKVPTDVSGNMGAHGFPKGPGTATIFYNPTHTFMRIGNRYWGTSGFARPGGGAGWFNQAPGSDYLSQFQEVHLPDLGSDAGQWAGGVGSIARLIAKGGGAMRPVLQKAIDKITGKANDFVTSKQPQGNPGSGSFGDLIPPGPGKVVGASEYGGPGDPTSGTHGADSTDLTQVWQSFAELKSNSALGHLPYGARAKITAPTGKSMVATKHDWGTGGADIAGHPRAIDLWYMLANALGLPGTSGMWSGLVKIQRAARGGEIGGPVGKAMRATVHAGEWVLNRVQQSKLAGLLGTSADRLRDMLGFTGGPTSFAGGGVVRFAKGRKPASGQSLAPASTDPNIAADTSLTDVASADPASLAKTFHDEIKAALEALGSSADAAFRRIGDQTKELHRLQRQNISDMTKREKEHHATRIKNLQQEIQSEMNRHAAVIGLHLLSGKHPGQATPGQQQAALQAAGIYQQILPGAADFDAAGNIAQLQAYNRTQSTLMRTVANNLSKHAKKTDVALNQFIANMNNVTGDNGIFALTATAIDTFVTNQGIRLQALQAGFRIIAGRFQAIGKSFGPGVQRGALGPVQSAAADLQSTVSELPKFQQELGAQTTALAAVNKQIHNLGPVTAKNLKQYQQLVGARNQLVKDINDTDAKIAQNYTDQFSKAQALFEATTTAALRPSTLQSQLASMYSRIGQALGDPHLTEAAGNYTIGVLESQRGILQARLKEAQAKAAVDPRWQAEADQIAQQLTDVTASIVEQQAQNLQNAIQATQAAQDRALATNDISGRFAEVQARLGDARGAAAARIAISQQRTGILQNNLSQDQGLLAQAQAQGNVQATLDLTAKIQDLTAQIAEQTATTQDLITANRQLGLDILTGMSSASTGFISSANSIVSKFGELVGSQELPTLIKLAKDTAASLAHTAGQIVDQIHQTVNDPSNPFGQFQGEAGGFLNQLSAAFQQGPTQYANTLAGLAPALAEFESNLPDNLKTLFDGLIQAMTDNTQATVDNNVQLKDLNGATNQQQFSSSAWQMFRQAIFDGMGHLLPQYGQYVPSAATGAYVQASGMLMAHAGETIKPAVVSRRDGEDGRRFRDVHLNIDHPVETADPVLLGNQFAWKLAHDPNTR